MLLDLQELRFVYENDSDFAAFPTFPIVLPFKGTEQGPYPENHLMSSFIIFSDSTRINLLMKC